MKWLMMIRSKVRRAFPTNISNIVICISLLKKLTSDVDNLEAGEGKDGEGVQL